MDTDEKLNKEKLWEGPKIKVPTKPSIEKQDMILYLLVEMKELLTEIKENTKPKDYKSPKSQDDDIEVEEYEYEGKEYLVDPKTTKIYTDEGDFIGYWYKDEPVLNPFR